MEKRKIERKKSSSNFKFPSKAVELTLFVSIRKLNTILGVLGQI